MATRVSGGKIVGRLLSFKVKLIPNFNATFPSLLLDYIYQFVPNLTAGFFPPRVESALKV